MFLGLNFALGSVPKVITGKKDITECLEIIEKPGVNLGNGIGRRIDQVLKRNEGL